MAVMQVASPPATLNPAVDDITDVLEMHVRRHPDLWLWMHRRWRDPSGAFAQVKSMFPAGAAEPSVSVIEGDEDAGPTA